MYKITDLASLDSITLNTYDDCLDQMREWQLWEHERKCDDECQADEYCEELQANHYRIEEIKN